MNSKPFSTIGCLSAIILNIGILSSCFDFSSSKFTDIGDGFKFGYYNGNLDLFNVYYHDGGIFPYVCTKVESNQSYIFVNCKNLKANEELCFILDKIKYKKNPIQFRSDGIQGPVNHDSLLETNFYKNNKSTMQVYTKP